MKKSLFEHAMAYKKFVKQFQNIAKKKLKNSDIKTSERQKKKLKNQMIYCLEIIETKQNIYD